MKLNLTTFTFIVAITLLSVFGIRQCGTKNVYKKQTSDLLDKNSSLKEQTVENHKAFVFWKTEHFKVLEQLKKSEAEQKEIRKKYALQKKELNSISADTLYKIYRQNHVLIGKVFLTDSILIKKDIQTRLELKECKEITHNYKTEVDFLDNALNVYADINKELNASLNDCELTRIGLEEDIIEQEIELKKTKKKVWTNRGISAGGIVLLVLVLL